jgi:hypothetical protein
MKTRLFKIAHAIKANFNSFGEALAFAWNVVKLQFRLCTQAVVNFTYKKVDGTIREAVGTTETVPTPKGGFRKPNFGILNYFDLQQQDWRCCRIENLIF